MVARSASLAVAGIGWLFLSATGGDQASAATTFRLEVSELGEITLTGCSDIGSFNEIRVFRSVSGPDFKVPGELSYLDIQCERGLSSDTRFNDWRRQVEDGGISDARRDVTLSLLDDTGTPVARWSLPNTWPAALVVSAGENGPVERLTLAVDNLERVVP